MMNNIDLFTKNLGPIVKITERIFDNHMDLLKWCPHAESIMDVGIGDGLVTTEVIIPHLPGKFKEYFGCDISEEALKATRERIKSPNVHLINMDISSRDIPLEYINRFDHIFCHRCLHNLHNVEDIRHAFRNFYKMLKPGGQFFISTFEESPLDQAFETLDDGKWSKYNHREAISCFYKYENPSKEFEKIIKREGFVDIHLRIEPDCFIPFTEKSFIGAHVPVNPIMSYVSDEDKEEYIQDFIAKAKEGSLIETISNGNPESDVHVVTVKLLVAIASKPLL